MKEQEFIKSLKEEVNNAVLPFEEGDWQKLRERLDKKQKKSIIPFIPFTSKSLSVGMGGVAAAFILFLLLVSKPEDGLKKRKDIVVSKQVENKEPIIQSKTENNNKNDIEKRTQQTPNPIITQIAKASIYSNKDSIINTKNGVVVSSPLPEIKEVSENNIDPQQSTINIALENTAEILNDSMPKTQHQFPSWENSSLKQASSNAILLAGGGLNYGMQNLGYALKLGLEKPITSRLSVHTALAINTNDRNITQSEIDRITTHVETTNIIVANSDGTFTNSTIYTVTSIDTSYKQVDKTFAQAFAQALIGLDYELYKGGKIGISADAFRLLRSKEQVDKFNNDLTGNTKASSLWNVGMRLQYTQEVTKHFDVGTLYRQDISSMLNNTWENNFLQLMLIYKLGNKR